MPDIAANVIFPNDRTEKKLFLSAWKMCQQHTLTLVDFIFYLHRRTVAPMLKIFAILFEPQSKVVTANASPRFFIVISICCLFHSIIFGSYFICRLLYVIAGGRSTWTLQARTHACNEQPRCAHTPTSRQTEDVLQCMHACHCQSARTNML